MYLREMGTVPLLTRDGEIELARRIEKGQTKVIRALSRSSLVMRELADLAVDLQDGRNSLRDILSTPDAMTADDEEDAADPQFRRFHPVHRDPRSRGRDNCVISCSPGPPARGRSTSSRELRLETVPHAWSASAAQSAACSSALPPGAASANVLRARRRTS